MLKFVTIFLFLGSAIAANQDTDNLLVDEFLYNVGLLLVQYKLDVLPMPAMSVKYNDQPLASWDTVTGSIETGPGTLARSTGIHRNGDAKITLVGSNQMVINVDIITDPWVISFDKFDMDFSEPLPFSSTDKGLQINVDKNIATVQITFEKGEGECKLSMDKAEVTSLGSFSLTIIPQSIWTKIKSKTVSVYLGAHSDDVRQVVNMYLQAGLQKAIDTIDPCKYIPF